MLPSPCALVERRKRLRPSTSRIGRPWIIGLAALAAMLSPFNTRTRAAEASNQRPNSEAVATAVMQELVNGVWESADSLFHNGDYEGASRLDRLAVRLDPNFVEGVSTLGWLLHRGLNRPDECLAVYHRGLKDNPNAFDLYFDLGMFYYAANKYALAGHYFRKATERNPPPMVYHMRAHAFEKMGRRTDAARVWRAVLEKFPADEIARRNLRRLESQE